MMRAVGIATVLLLVVLSISSMMLPPEKVEPLFPSWWRPAADRGPVPKPLDWNVPIQYLKPIVNYCGEGWGGVVVPVWIAARVFSHEATSDGTPTNSNWQADAVSWVGAQGVPQIMPYNHALFVQMFNDGVDFDPFDVDAGIRVGVRYLAYLYKMLGDWRSAVESYNCGPGRWLKGDLPAETVYYGLVIMGPKEA